MGPQEATVVPCPSAVIAILGNLRFENRRQLHFVVTDAICLCSCGNIVCISLGLHATFEIPYEIHPRYTFIQTCRASALSYFSSFSCQFFHKLLPKLNISTSEPSYIPVHMPLHRVRGLTETLPTVLMLLQNALLSSPYLD